MKSVLEEVDIYKEIDFSKKKCFYGCNYPPDRLVRIKRTNRVFKDLKLFLEEFKDKVIIYKKDDEPQVVFLCSCWYHAETLLERYDNPDSFNECPYCNCNFSHDWCK